jgi:hypothetical protein
MTTLSSLVGWCGSKSLTPSKGASGFVASKVANAIIDLIDGRSSEEMADELGWDLEDVMKIHPDNISDRTLELIAEENYWENEHIEDLGAKLQRYRSERK